MIQDVERFRAELQSYSLIDAIFPEHRDIGIGEILRPELASEDDEEWRRL